MIPTSKSHRRLADSLSRRIRATPRVPRVESLEARELMAAIALADSYRVIQDTPLSVGASGILANDLIASGNSLNIGTSSQPSHGSVVVNNDGSFLYTPSAGYFGLDSYSYTVSDGLGNSASASVNLEVVECNGTAQVTAGPRLASVDSTRGVLLNSLLGGLLGTSLNVNALDWNAIATGDVNGLALVDALQANLGVATTSEALTTNATVAQILSAAATAAQADGDTALASALNSTIAQVGGLAGTIKLGDLLQVDPNDGSLADAQLNALDLLTGTVQLFNFRNVVTTPTPITISGSSLGLQGILTSVQLSAQVVEPPVYVGGGVGTEFHTASLRLKLNLDLLDTNPNVTSLVSALTSSLLGVATVQVGATLGQIQLYAEVASGDGVLTQVDAVNGLVGIRATPGVANLYAGTIADSLFFNRNRAIVPATDVTFGTIGSLSIVLRAPILNTVLANVSAGIQIKGSGLGQAPLNQNLLFTSPFPETQTVGSSASSASSLLTSLIADLSIQLNGTLGGLLDPLVNGVVLPALKPIVANTLSPILATTLSGLVDPALETLGVGLGEMVVTVSGLNDHCPPQANNDVAGTPKGVAKVINVLSNDAFEAGDTLTITAVTPPAHGTATILGNGTIRYTPSASYVGLDSFTYSIANAFGGTSTATVSVTVSPPANQVPVAVNDSYTTNQATPLIVNTPGVLANDTDLDGNTLTTVLVSAPAHGILVLNANGSFVYTPDPSYRGADSFTYRATDGTALSGLATVNLTISAVNTAPVALLDAYAVAQGSVLTVATPGVLANDVDLDGDALTAVLVAGPQHGTLTLNANGSFVYTPDPTYRGLDGFTYRASDGTAVSLTSSVTLTVTPVNNAPVAVGDSYTVAQEGVLSVTAPGVLGNDTDLNGDTLSALLVTAPQHGVLVLSPTGSFLYTPDPSYRGSDSFTYRATDGTALSGLATVNLTITPVNHAPVAVSDIYAVAQAGVLNVTAPGVLGNDADIDGDTITTQLFSGPSNGTLTLNANGSFTYTPTAIFQGIDSFSYRVSDGTTLSGVATVTITVIATGSTNTAPTAVADAYTVAQQSVLAVSSPGVLTNDTDPNNDSLSAILASGPLHGVVVLNANGSFVYTPDPLYRGADSFSYRAFDGVALSGIATVSITVTPVNRAPVSFADAYVVAQESTLTVSTPGVIANDIDIDGDSLTAVLVTGVTQGSLTLNANGSFVYTPNPTYRGLDGFTYRAFDGTTFGASTTVTLTVTPVNHAPVALADTYTVAQESALTTSSPGVLGNDTDSDGDGITAILVGAPAHGALVLNANGSFIYTPNPTYRGVDSFSYRASDGASLSATATVTITVTPVNHVPITVADTFVLAQESVLTVGAPGVLGNDTDVDGDPLSAAIVSQPVHGTLVLNTNGSFTYTPDPTFRGTDGFTYRSFDGTISGGIASVTLIVTAVNHAPVAAADQFTTAEEVTLSVAAPGVLGNDTDVDGDQISAVLVTGTAHGAILLNTDGSFIYTPNPLYDGPDSFTYRAFDGVTFSAATTVSLTVSHVNHAPVVVADVYAVAQGTTLTVGAPGVLGNDIDVDGDALTAVLVTGPAHGTLTLNANGSFTYLPSPSYRGPDSFTYRAGDGSSLSGTVAVNLTVAAVNHAPVAVADSYAVTAGTSLVVASPGVLANDSDSDGDAIVPIVVANPLHGTLALAANGSFVYTPTAGYRGSDMFTYQLSDGTTLGNVITVAIAVNGVNQSPTSADDPPSVLGDAYVTLQDTILFIAGPGILANDIDPEGDTLVPVLATPPSHGTVALGANGSFIYTPAPGYSGPDSFTYRAFDGTSLGNAARVVIRVTPVIVAPPNGSPVANPDVYEVIAGGTLTVSGSGVLANDLDPERSPIAAFLVRQPAHGTVTLRADGSFTYKPTAGYIGTDQFAYAASDGNSFGNVTSVTVRVVELGQSLVTPPALVGKPTFRSIKRLGFHNQPTQIILSFNGSLDPGRAQNLANYNLRMVKSQLRGRVVLGKAIKVAGAVYNDVAKTVTLTFVRPFNFRPTYQLKVSSSTNTGVSNQVGVLLDGNGDGNPGGDLIIQFGRAALAGASSPKAASVKAHAATSALNPSAVDRLFSDGFRPEHSFARKLLNQPGTGSAYRGLGPFRDGRDHVGDFACSG